MGWNVLGVIDSDPRCTASLCEKDVDVLVAFTQSDGSDAFAANLRATSIRNNAGNVGHLIKECSRSH